MKKLALAFAVLALSVASAKTYSLTLFQNSVLNGTELKAGTYKLDVESDKIVVRAGKQSVEAAVKVETSQTRYNATTVRYANGDGKYRIQEIRLGGTGMKLVVD
jgi:hypothetical protein